MGVSRGTIAADELTRENARLLVRREICGRGQGCKMGQGCNPVWKGLKKR